MEAALSSADHSTKDSLLLEPRPLTDRKAIELASYVDTLEASDQWKSCFQRPTVRLEALKVPPKQRTKLSSEVPAFRISINFEGNLDPMFVFRMYMDPQMRKQWDERVVCMTLRPDGEDFLFHQQFLFNRPLADRDFVTKLHLVPVDGGFKALFYSVKNREFGEKAGVERSKVHVGMYRFQQRGEVTTMDIVQQVDMHFSLLRVQQLVPLFLIDWAARFREECLKRARC